MRLLIVGGVAGGATAAARARRLSEEAEIVLFERGFYVSYANCGLPYYIGGEIEKRDDLFIASPERLEKRYRIDVRTSQEVLALDLESKEVRVRDHRTGDVFREPYDRLILSPGAVPTRPPLPGIELPGIFTLRDLPDSDRIKAHLEERGVERAVVVGGGPIGLESVENISRHNARVVLVEMLDHVMPPLDYEMAALIHRALRDRDVQLILGDGVASFSRSRERLRVTTRSGVEIESDMVVLAIGVKPEKRLAEKAGLRIGEQGGIAVDEEMRTSDPNVFAVGDAVEVTNAVTGRASLIPLAGPANRQGRIAADNALGRHEQFPAVRGTNVTKVFDLVAASTGSNERTLEKAGIPCRVSVTHSRHHASYYPGARSMAVKLLFDPEDGVILGAQVVGEAGVDKRIDVLSTALHAGMTVYDLEELELAYAPQFGSAKDPVNIAGFVAANMLKGDVEVLHWHELDGLDPDRYVLLDVRTRQEVTQTGTIRNALHIHIDELRDRLGELDPGKVYVAYCTVSMRGYLAYRILVQSGFEARILSGGLETWEPVQEDRKTREAAADLSGAPPASGGA
jgi:NADPH-dependent 2,4-dienoyl-CoA reductase/sulfur reductase-like enzyme/rhodanese-related sulfurtransferase